MCYSQRTSLISYSLGILAAILAFSTKQYILGSLILVFSQIQLSELLIWKGIDDNSSHLNKIGTAYGKYTLPMHPMAIGLGILITIYIAKQTIRFCDTIPFILGLLFYLYVIYFIYKNQEPKETFPFDNCKKRECQNNANRLIWPYETSWYLYGFILSLCFLILYSQSLACFFFIVSFYIVACIFDKRVFSSLWCFSAAISAPLLVYLNYKFMMG
jgi:hypothetical protein